MAKTGREGEMEKKPGAPAGQDGLRGRGLLFVVSSTSGGGKTTLLRRLVGKLGDLRISVSHTTRPPRPGEQDGIDYHFVSVPAFERMIRKREFLEWARVHDQYYGTSRASVRSILEQGGDVLLDIDVQGAMQVRKKWPGCVLIFIVPPGEGELRRRLRRRGTETPEQLEKRISAARQELAFARHYDYAVLNNQLKDAERALKAVVMAERCRVATDSLKARQEEGSR